MMSTTFSPGHQVPIVETARLRLRGYQPSDFAAWAALWQQPDFYRYISGVPLPEEEAWARLLRTIGHWALLGYGFWAVEEKASGRFIGSLGFGNFRREIAPPIGEAPEAGWVLDPASHGQGYATEALTAALGWAETHFGLVRMVCLIHPENAASLRVAARFGFRPYAATDYKGQPGLLLERLPESHRHHATTGA